MHLLRIRTSLASGLPEVHRRSVDRADCGSRVVRPENRPEVLARTRSSDRARLAHSDAVPRFRGIYLVLRLETGGPGYQREILVLYSKKMKGGYSRHALYIRPQIIYRGAWQVLDGLIGFTMWAMAVLLLRHALA